MPPRVTLSHAARALDLSFGNAPADDEHARTTPICGWLFLATQDANSCASARDCCTLVGSVPFRQTEQGACMTYQDDHWTRQKTYSTPRLKVYGSVLALTTGGTGPTPETGASCEGPTPVNDGVVLHKHCV